MLTFVLSVLFNYRSYLRAKVLGVFQINFPKKVYFLPADVDSDVVTATMADGVLKILFGKSETAKKIKIG